MKRFKRCPKKLTKLKYISFSADHHIGMMLKRKYKKWIGQQVVIIDEEDCSGSSLLSSGVVYRSHVAGKDYVIEKSPGIFAREFIALTYYKLKKHYRIM